jgi:hypothetical protein
VRKHWIQLIPSEKEDFIQKIGTFLLSLLSVNAMNKPLLNRIIRILAAAVIRLPVSIDSYLSLSHQCIQLQANQQLDCFLGYDMITVLYEELEDSDNTRNTKAEIEEKIRNSLTAALNDSSKNLSNLSFQFPGKHLSVLKLLESNLKLGLSIAHLQEDYPQLLIFLQNHLTSTGFDSTSSSSILSLAHSIFRDLLAAEEYPVSGRNALLRSQLMDAFVLSVHRLLGQGLLKDQQSHSFFFTEILLSLILIATKKVNQISSTDNNTDQSVQSIFSVLFAIISMPSRHFLLLTFDFWFEIESMAPEERSEYLNTVVIHQLLDCLLTHCIYKEDDEDDEDFLALRNEELGIKDLFRFCFESLPTQFFSLLQTNMNAFQSNYQQWQKLEVVLFVLFCAMASLKEFFSLQRGGTEELLNFLLDAALINFQYLQSVSLSAVSSNLLCDTLLRVVTSLTFLLPGKNQINGAVSVNENQRNKFTTIFQTGLKFSFSIAMDYQRKEELRKTSSETIHRLLIAGRFLIASGGFGGGGTLFLREIVDLFFSLLNPTTISSQTDISNLNKIVDALSIVCFLIPGTDQQICVSQLVQPVISGLKQYVPQLIQTADKNSLVTCRSLLNCALHFFASSMKISSDDFSSVQNQEMMIRSILPSLLSELWPTLQQIFSSRSNTTTTRELLPTLFSFYSNALLAVGGIDGFPFKEDLFNNLLTILSTERKDLTLLRFVVHTATDVVDSLMNAVSIEEGKKKEYLLQIIGIMTKTLLEIIQTNGIADNSLDSDLFRFYFDCLSLYLRKRKEMFIGTGILPSSIHISFWLLQQSLEADCLQAIISYFLLLFALDVKELQNVTSVDHIIVQEVHPFLPQLVQLSFRQLSSPQSHSKVVPMIGDILSSLIILLCSCFPSDTTDSVLMKVVRENQTIVDRFDEESVTVMIALFKKMAFMKTRRYKAFVIDVAKICLSESSTDVLASYSDMLME